MSKYSIIIPVRNGGAYVKECVHSILSQTLNNFNLLILDNCSTDGTLQWIQSIKDERIQLYAAVNPLSIEENWGRIKDIEKNEFITIIGHDDLLDPHYLLTMDKLINMHPNAGLYQAHFRFINASGNFKRHCKPMDQIQYAHEFIAQQFQRTFDSMGTGYMMRSKDYDRFGGMPDYTNLIFGDYELWVRLTMLSYKATTLHECFSYREHDSTSRATDGDKYQHAFGRYVLFLREVMNKDVAIKEIVERYGPAFLMYFCQSLSHRILKTPVANRNIEVKEFIDKCIGYANLLFPDQTFDPRDVFKIKIAEHFDSSTAGRALFKLYKTLPLKPL